MVRGKEARVRVLLQRVREARVEVEGNTVGAIGRGILLFVGIGPHDTDAELRWMAKKIAALRIFPDDEGKMNRSVVDVGGGALVVSQFTLYGDVRKGNRPSFVRAAPPDRADAMYGRFADRLAEHVTPVARGEFAADMQVHLVNDGPVTLWLEREAD